MYSFFLTIQVIFLIGQVWLIRRNLGKKPLALPAVDAERTVDSASSSAIVRHVDRLYREKVSIG